MTSQSSWPQRAYVALSDWDVLSVSGNDRVDFLSGLTSNKIKGQPRSGGCASLLLTAKGRIISELLIFQQPEALLVLLEPSQGEAVQQALDAFLIMEDVTLRLSGDEWTPVLLAGDAIPHTLSEAGCTMPEAGKGEDWGPALGWETSLWATQIPRLGALPSVFVWVPADRETAFLGWCQEQAFEALDAETWGELRTEQGWYSQGVIKDLLVHEVGLEHSHVSYNKGCFVGQEVVARTEHRGRANNTLALFQAEGTVSLTPTLAILDADGKTQGHIRQEVPSKHGKGVHCALIKRKALEQESSLVVHTPEGNTVGLKQLSAPSTQTE